MGGSQKSVYTVSEAVKAAAKYCAYSERSHRDVKLFLSKKNCPDDVIEESLAELISLDFLNESRFATAYVSGKLRQNGWGRIKIRKGLYERGVSEYTADKAMEEIDDDEYSKVFSNTAEKKLRELCAKGKKDAELKASLMRFLASRGFEQELILSFTERESL